MTFILHIVAHPEESLANFQACSKQKSCASRNQFHIFVAIQIAEYTQGSHL